MPKKSPDIVSCDGGQVAELRLFTGFVFYPLFSSGGLFTEEKSVSGNKREWMVY
jgi:hypothetical protein